MGLFPTATQLPRLLRPSRPRDPRRGTQPPAREPTKLLVFVAVINSVAAATFLVVVMWIPNDKRIMGDYVNGRAAKTLGWLTATIMAVAAVALVVTGDISL